MTDLIKQALDDASGFTLNERRKELIRLQAELTPPCLSVAPDTCWNCGKDIVTEKWAEEQITGCPYCHTSFVG